MSKRILYLLSASVCAALAAAVVAVVAAYLSIPLAELSNEEKLIYAALWILTMLLAGFFLYWGMLLLGGCCAKPESIWHQKAKKFADANLQDGYWGELKKDILIPVLIVTALIAMLRRSRRR